MLDELWTHGHHKRTPRGSPLGTQDSLRGQADEAQRQTPPGAAALCFRQTAPSPPGPPEASWDLLGLPQRAPHVTPKGPNVTPKGLKVTPLGFNLTPQGLKLTPKGPT